MDPIADVRSHLQVAANEPDYTAVNTLWLVLLKLANLEQGQSELARMKALVDRIPLEKVASVVNDSAVDALLNLEPPLETVVSHRLERLDTDDVTEALQRVRAQRAAAPREALAGLGFVLKAIRNKREHGFKTQAGPRDAEILRSARQVLDRLGRAALEARVSAEPSLN